MRLPTKNYAQLPPNPRVCETIIKAKKDKAWDRKMGEFVAHHIKSSHTKILASSICRR